MANVGSCGVCWKLRHLLEAQRVAGKARNMTENALSILIVFSVQLQQTEISDRKLFIFQHGHPVDNFFNINLTKNIIEHKRCRI